MNDAFSIPIIWSARALRDLTRIRAYLCRFAPNAVQRFTSSLVETVDSLGEHPNLGQLISQDVQELVAVRPYLVLYKITADGVRIVHIRHGAERPE